MQSQRQSPKPSSQKKTLTLEAWESKSPLSDLGKDAIASISQTRLDRSFPTIFESKSKIFTPLSNTPNELPSTPQPSSLIKGNNEIIATPQQFLKWFEDIENSIDDEHLSIYQHHMDNLNHEIDICQSIMARINDIDFEVKNIENQFHNVNNRTTELETICQKYIDEREELMKMKEFVDHQRYLNNV